MKIVVAIVSLVVVVGIVLGVYSGFNDSTDEQQSIAEMGISELEKKIEENPYDYDLRLAIADNYRYEGRYGEAIEQLEIVLEQFEYHETATWILGIVHMEQKDYKKAIEQFIVIVEHNVDNPLPHLNKVLMSAQFNLGDAYIKIDEPEKAIEPLLANVEASSTDADSRRMLGLAYQMSGDCNQAIEYFYGAIRFDPQYKEAYEGLADCYSELGDDNETKYAEAMVKYSDAKYKMKYEEKIRDEVEYLYYEAISDLEEVVVVSPDFVKAQYGLGLLYEEVGQIDNAIMAFETVLDLEPDNSFVEGRIKNLKTKR